MYIVWAVRDVRIKSRVQDKNQESLSSAQDWANCGLFWRCQSKIGTKSGPGLAAGSH